MPLTPLTVKEMDEINFLLTEVSLELLGNRFYDIHGENKNGLAALYASGPMPLSNNLNCDLIKKLDMEYLLPKNSSTYNHNDDFLVPMDDDGVNGEAAIANRRQVSQQQQRTAAKVKRRRQTSAVSSTAKATTAVVELNEQQAVEEQAAVVDHIQKLVESETNRMLKNSDRCKDEYYFRHNYRIESESIDERDIVDEFYTQEKDNLSLESVKLMQLIKFMKSDPRNMPQMKTIAANILHVKDLI